MRLGIYCFEQVQFQLTQLDGGCLCTPSRRKVPISWNASMFLIGVWRPLRLEAWAHHLHPSCFSKKRGGYPRRAQSSQAPRGICKSQRSSSRLQWAFQVCRGSTRSRKLPEGEAKGSPLRYSIPFLQLSFDWQTICFSVALSATCSNHRSTHHSDKSAKTCVLVGLCKLT